MNDILMRQLALDYCCSPEEAADRANHFRIWRKLPGRRCFQENSGCFLKLAVVGGKLLFAGREEIIAWCRERYAADRAAWFLEPKNLRALDDRLHAAGWQIEMLHPFYIAEQPSALPETQYSLRFYEAAEIEAFRGDERFGEAFCFDPAAPDLLGVAAVDGERILGMAGASGDSPTMWQIGINVLPEAQGRGIAKTLVAALKNEVLRRGILPFYGTSFSHLASQRTALAAGFSPAWVELVTSPLPQDPTH